MTVNLDELCQFFAHRHVTLKETWIQAVLRFSQTSNKSQDESSRFIYDQWLRSNLQLSSEARFQQPTGKMIAISCVFQIVSILDISRSLHQQKKLDADLEVQTPMVFDPNYDFRVSPKRMYLFELSDGQTTVKAIEHEVVPTLTNQMVGCKLMINGRVQFRDEHLLLTPLNCQVLGGYTLDKKK